MEEIEKLRLENEELKRNNEKLLEELKSCRDETVRQIAVVSAIKKDMRRTEVQLNSLKTENEEFKNKFAKIENNALGRFALKIYRALREFKRRRAK